MVGHGCPQAVKSTGLGASKTQPKPAIYNQEINPQFINLLIVAQTYRLKNPDWPKSESRIRPGAVIAQRFKI